jgi:hypothetical protein
VTRYCWVADRKAEGFPIMMACKVAEVSRQAFYDWQLRLAGGPTANQGILHQPNGFSRRCLRRRFGLCL